jgi:mannitol/fructose-specific phosphotransferase system IIA component (Ntr-type)
MSSSTAMNFWKQFKPKVCSVQLKASTKEDALQEIVDNLVHGGALDEGFSGPAVRALLERERRGSTGVGMNVAIPHIKLPELTRVACSLSIHPEGLEWSAVDGAPVQLIFTVLRPEGSPDGHDPELHLDMMQWIARLGRDQDFRRFATRVKTKTELIDLLKEMSAV